MRPSRSTAPPPASLTSGPKSSATKRQRKAAAAAVPLGDVTNLLVLAETTTPTKPRRTARGALPARSDVSAVSSTCSSSASVTHAPKPSAATCVTPARKPSFAAAVTPAPKPSSAARVAPAPKPSAAARVTPAPKPSSAAGGRWRRNPTAANGKGKEPVAATASCPLPGKSASTTSCRKKDTRPISASDPCHEGKKKRSIASTPNLLEDILEKQRAYFAEIDAFELVEEEVSESELE